MLMLLKKTNFTGLKILFLLLTLHGIDAVAQFKSAKVGIDGLTCSMCSNSVERLIRQLDFVADVKMDLNNTTAEVIFKEGKKINISDIAKKVTDSGFSVRSIDAIFLYHQATANTGSSYTYEGDEYIFVKAPGTVVDGETKITFIGKKFMSSKEFVHWKNLVSKYKGSSSGKSQVYHIAL